MTEKIAIAAGAPLLNQFQPGQFWTRENGLTIEQVCQQRDQLRDLPVEGTSFLIDEGYACVVAVPYRWRN